MFRKILMVEDTQNVSIALVQALQQRPVMKLHHVRCFESAMSNLNRSIADNDPYDLVVTELSFRESSSGNRLANGEELIAVIKKKCPQIKILVFSTEEDITRIHSLFKNFEIDGYVLRGRKILTEFKRAVTIIYPKQDKFLSAELIPLLEEITIQ